MASAANERVEVSGDRLRLMVGPRTIDAASPDQFRKLVWVSPADSLFHGEETYYVGFLDDRVWVLPYLTAGIRAFLEAVPPLLAATGALFAAETAGCPASWRRRLLGVVPLFPSPALGSHPVESVPEFLGLKPVSLPEIQEGASADA